MKRVLLVLVALAAVGCKNHLLFVEGSHMGLMAKVKTSEVSPLEVDLGYRRGMVVVIPRQDVAGSSSEPKAQVTTDESTKTVVVQQDVGEVMSVFSRFRANVGLFDDVSVRHFLATGNAASLLIASKTDLSKLTSDWDQGAGENEPDGPENDDDDEEEDNS